VVAAAEKVAAKLGGMSGRGMVPLGRLFCVLRMSKNSSISTRD
jgi:hypothetical protein